MATNTSTSAEQVELAASDRGRIMAMDSAYHVTPANRDRDVVVNASYCGVLPARFIGAQRPRGAIGVDCGIGPAGASIAGLWYLEALEIPAAVADVMTVHLGDGVHLYENGIVSFRNRPAADCGVEVGMSVRVAADLVLSRDAPRPHADEITHRTVVYTAPNGRSIVCTDSIAFGLPEDRGTNVLVTAGHTGRSAVPYLTKVAPLGFICSDGGKGLDDAGVAGMYIAEEHGLAGATVDARTSPMGDGLASYHQGVISARNALAAAAGVEIGQPASDAARSLLGATD